MKFNRLLIFFLCSWSFCFQFALAQPAPIPTLPETIVEGNRTTDPEIQQPSNSSAEPSIFSDSMLDGTIFDSPPISGYYADSSTSSTIVNIADADIPATVNTITREILDDQIVLRFTDAIRNAGGVTPAGDGLFGDRIFIRGLEVGARNFRKDGFLDPTFVPRDFQNVERVEIVKGPVSVLYGAGDPAGMVNLITKKPLAARFADVGYTFGSWNQSRFTLDANGYVEEGNVLYRVNIAQEDADSFVDFDDLSRTQISPAITWLVNDNTSLTWSGEWHRHKTGAFQGTPAVNGNPLFLPPNQNIGEPGNDFLDAEEFRQSLVLQHQLNDDWWLSVGGYSLFYSYPNSTTAAGMQVFPNPPLFVRSRNSFPFADEESHSVIANLAGEFCTGPIQHTALIGMEYNYFDSDTQLDSGGLLTPIDVSDPVYANPPATPFFTADFPVFRQQRFGVYLQDFIEITPHWKALLGVRFDNLDFEFERNLGFGEVETQQTFDNIAPRGGLVYQPWADDTLSVFYSYAQSFNAPGGGIYLNGDLQPILGESHEFGIKSELFEGLSMTASGFHVTRENDSFDAQSIVFIQVGEVRSQGAEVNLIGEISDRWNIIANYTYTDARLSDVNPLFNGQRARNVPFNSANLWTRYNLYQDECATFGAAMGFVYSGSRPADIENDLFLPGYNRWDGGLYYRCGNWNTNLYLENLFDVQYANSSINEFQIYQGAPFNARASVSYRF